MAIRFRLGKIKLWCFLITLCPCLYAMSSNAQQPAHSNNLSNPANPQSPLNPENPRSLNKEMVRKQLEQEKNRGKDVEKFSPGINQEKKSQPSAEKSQGVDASNPSNPRHLVTPSPTR